MASIPFTLAALSTSAVPGLVVFGVREHESDEGFLSAVIATEDDDLLVRVPRTQQAEVRQSAELLGLAALTEGPRSRLPFEVPAALGMTRAGDTRAVVTTFLDGARFEASDLTDDAILLQPLAEAIAAIHDLPLTVAQHGGLPVRSAQDLRVLATRLVDRADATRLLPETVRRRWTHVLETSDLWDFAPTMVHGSLDAEWIRVDDGSITAVLGWSECGIGDPASDLAWLLAAGTEVLDGVIARYARARNSESLSHLRARAALYHELEVARWLLHGTETHDQAVIDDAVAMLDRMVGTGGALGSAFTEAVAAAPLSSEEVIALLERTPRIDDSPSDTAAFEALDEDRMFGVDTDFIEPLSEDAEATGAEHTDPEATGAEHTDVNRADAEETDVIDPLTDSPGDGAPSGSDAIDRPHDAEQLTEPLSDEDLPGPPRR